MCNRLVGFILPRDPGGKFHFVAIQSDLGRSLIRMHGRNPDALDTVYVVADHRSDKPVLYERARAALFVLKELGAPWSLAAGFGILPDAVLNALYDAVAARRYRIFGRCDTCLAPTPEYRSRFDDAGPE